MNDQNNHSENTRQRPSYPIGDNEFKALIKSDEYVAFVQKIKEEFSKNHFFSLDKFLTEFDPIGRADLKRKLLLEKKAIAYTRVALTTALENGLSYEEASAIALKTYFNVWAGLPPLKDLLFPNTCLESTEKSEGKHPVSLLDFQFLWESERGRL